VTVLKWIHLTADRNRCRATAHSNERSIATTGQLHTVMKGLLPQQGNCTQ